jgi:mannose-6-phosphate isomerase
MHHEYDFDITSRDKKEVFQQAGRLLINNGFKLIDFDIMRPWGFFLSVDESQSADFIKEFYAGVKLQDIDTNLPLRPKFLGVEPDKRLSWQYHHRRAEVWRCLAGEFELITGEADTEDKQQKVVAEQVVNMPQGMRHRGVGWKTGR